MPVIVYPDTNLTGLAIALSEKNPDVPLAEIHSVLTTIGIANRAAAADADEIKVPILGAEADVDVWPTRMYPNPRDTTPIRWAETLLYNCISDTGIDFAPHHYAIQLLKWAGLSHAEARLWTDPEKLLCTACGWHGDVLDMSPFKTRLFKCPSCSAGIEHQRGR
jgi:hypothetical protein